MSHVRDKLDIKSSLINGLRVLHSSVLPSSVLKTEYTVGSTEAKSGNCLSGTVRSDFMLWTSLRKVGGSNCFCTEIDEFLM